MPYLRAYRADEQPDDGTMLFVASSAGVKRDGLEIDQSKWRLDNYTNNPVVLLSHDYMSPPIGTAAVHVEDGNLMARVKWDIADPRAAEVAGKYARGVMNAVSVGWDDVKEDGQRARRGDAVAGHELLDISAVSVPGDPDALAQRMIRALREMDQHAETTEEPEEVSEPVQDQDAGVATAMVAVFVPGSDEDEAREADYRALLPAYRHAGLTPPPFRTNAELAAMDAPTWCAQFVSGELGRAGAVLNKRNESALREAMTLIAGVLESAQKEAPEGDAKNETERAAVEALLRAISGDSDNE